MEKYWGRGGTAPRVLHLKTRWRSVVKFPCHHPAHTLVTVPLSCEWISFMSFSSWAISGKRKVAGRHCMDSFSLRRDANVWARATLRDRSDLWNLNNSDPSIYGCNTQHVLRSLIVNTDDLSPFQTCSCKISRFSLLIPLMTRVNFVSTNFFHLGEVKSRYFVRYLSVNSERSRSGFNAIFVYLCFRVYMSRVCIYVYM
jgi:hypothetical protein